MKLNSHLVTLQPLAEERIDFVSLLLRNKRHAAQAGEILLPVGRILV